MANEKRLISYDVVIAHLDSCIEQGKGLFKSVCVAIKCFVEQMPTVDAVEVVRCKDCDFRIFDDVCKEYCCNNAYGLNGAIEDNSFCSYGERINDK